MHQVQAHQREAEHAQREQERATGCPRTLRGDEQHRCERARCVGTEQVRQADQLRAWHAPPRDLELEQGDASQRQDRKDMPGDLDAE
jgi:hypothetical protein